MCFNVGGGQNKYSCVSNVNDGCYVSSSCNGACATSQTCTNKAYSTCLVAGSGFNYACVTNDVAVQNRDGCYIASNCQNSCASGFTCLDKSTYPTQACWGSGNTAGWNKYTCVQTAAVSNVDGCYTSSTCSGACEDNQRCEDEGSIFGGDCYGRGITGSWNKYKCNAISCASGQVASDGMCYTPAPAVPPAPASCPTLITTRTAGHRQQDDEPQRPRSLRSLPSRQRRLEEAEHSDDVTSSEEQQLEEAVIAEEDAVTAALASGTPKLVNAATRLYHRRFRHFSDLTGELTAFDYRVKLRSAVVNLDGVEVECAALNTSVVGVSLPPDYAAGVRVGSLLLTALTTPTCNITLQHRVISVTATAILAAAEEDTTLFFNASAFTFFQGSPDAWLENVGNGSAVSMPGGASADAHDAEWQQQARRHAQRRRSLLATSDFSAPLGNLANVDLFNIANRNVYCDSAVIVACRNCKLQGSMNVLVSVDGGNEASVTRATGSLTLTQQARIRLRGGVLSENVIGYMQPWCIPPICIYVPIFGIASVQVGVRVGMELLSEVFSGATGDIDVDLTAGVTVNLDGGSGASGSPSMSVVFTGPASNPATTTPLTATASTLFGIKPTVQVGVWGGAAACVYTCIFGAGARLAVYASGTFVAYAQFGATLSTAMLPASPLAARFPTCAPAHNLEMSVSLGVKDTQLAVNVDAAVFLSVWSNSWAWSKTLNIADGTPVPVWAYCVNLAPPPPPSVAAAVAAAARHRRHRERCGSARWLHQRHVLLHCAHRIRGRNGKRAGRVRAASHHPERDGRVTPPPPPRRRRRAGVLQRRLCLHVRRRQRQQCADHCVEQRRDVKRARV